MSFRTALTGLNAATADLGVISNNIANNNTTGFKSSRAEFGDIFSLSSLGTTTPRDIGSGVQLLAVAQQFGQGNITTTNNPLDIAVDGEGFFRLNSSGNILFTRAGAFHVDKEGYIVNAQDERLTGFAVDSGGNLSRTLTDLQMSVSDIEPQATTSGEIGLNLDASSQPPVSPPTFSISNSDTFNYTTALTIYDSLGLSHTLSMYFIKDATSNLWQIELSVDGTDPAYVTFPDNTLQFTEGGLLDLAATPQPLSATIDFAAVNAELGTLSGAGTPQTIELNFGTATQFGGEFSTNTLTQDGFTSGSLSGADISNDGVIFGRYSNGEASVLGQVALATFRNSQGLRPVGDTSWVETSPSGVALVQQPGVGAAGLVRSGALEESNVELTESLVNMINAQRNFQANAQVVQTSNELTQTIINLR